LNITQGEALGNVMGLNVKILPILMIHWESNMKAKATTKATLSMS